MSTSTKTPASIRQGGPGASHENAKEPLHVEKPPGTIRNAGTAIVTILMMRKEKVAAPIQLRRTGHEH